jgi:hypothetical protein
MRSMFPLLIPLAFLAACASRPTDTTFTIPPGQYAAAFDAAKQTIREAEFELARIDARGGVIASLPRASSGYATPWIRHGSSFNDDVEGLAHYQRRQIRITFAPEGADATADPPSADTDLREHQGTLIARVEVDIERIYKPGRRLDATSARLTSFATDPDLVDRGLQPLFTAEHRPDPALAARIAHEISTRVLVAETAPPNDAKP